MQRSSEELFNLHTRIATEMKKREVEASNIAIAQFPSFEVNFGCYRCKLCKCALVRECWGGGSSPIARASWNGLMAAIFEELGYIRKDSPCRMVLLCEQSYDKPCPCCCAGARSILYAPGEEEGEEV